MTTLTWDALGGDPAPGDTSAYNQLASNFSETASNASAAYGKLNAFTKSVDDSVWRGPAADAFRGKIGELPPRLAKLHDSYAAASDAMSGYSRTLADLQSQAARLLGLAQSAHTDQVTQQNQRTQATQQDPTASTASYDQAIATAKQQLSGVQNQIQHLRDQRTGAETTAIGKLDHASDLGIHNDPWWKEAWDSVSDWVDKHVDLLKEISSILKAVSAVAGLLSFIPFLAPICGPLALITAGLALGIDFVLCATGHGDWKSLAVDAALMALPGAGRLLSKAGGLLRGAGELRGASVLAKAGEGGLPMTGVARFDRLAAGTEDFARWSSNLQGRGFQVVEKALREGEAGGIERAVEGHVLTVDPAQFRYIDMLHESRHVAQIERAAKDGINVWPKPMRALCEKGAYEYELRLGQQHGFDPNYMNWARSRIDDYWTRSVAQKFARSPSYGNLLKTFWR